MSAIPADQQYRLMTGNADTIQAMGMMPALTSVWEKSHTESLEHQNVASKRGGELLSVSKFIRFLMQVLMLRGGAYLIILNVFTPGMMIAGTILLARALAPVEQTIGTWRQVVQAREAYGRLKDYLINPPPRSEVGDLPAPTGALFVRELSYQLQGMEKPILFNIACDVTPGMMLVLAGPSAAGKSTLAKLMTGVIPATRGHARLDGADLFQWSREEVGQYIGYLPQSPALFLGTIAENIARMQPDRQDEVIEVAKLVGIHELILKLPNGYDTPVGFSDLGLSGGQLQMIAQAAMAGNLSEGAIHSMFQQPLKDAHDRSIPDFYDTLEGIAKSNGIGWEGKFRREDYEAIISFYEKYCLDDTDETEVSSP